MPLPIHKELIERLRCADPTARELLEAVVEVRSDIRKTKSEFQAADLVVLRSHDFPAGNSLTVLNATTEVTLSPGGQSASGTYEVYCRVSITPVVPGAGSNTHTLAVAVETDTLGTGTWVERFAFHYEVIRKVGESNAAEVRDIERFVVNVVGLSTSSKLRLRIKSASGPGTFAVHGFNLATDADRFSGVKYHTGPALLFQDGGGVSLADTIITKISHATSDQFEIDLNGPAGAQDASPFFAARIVWGKDDSPDLTIDRITAFLHPKQDAGQAKDVAFFICQPWAIRTSVRLAAGHPDFGTSLGADLVPLADPISIPAGDGTSAQDYTFSWVERMFRGGRIGTPEGKPRPKSVPIFAFPTADFVEYVNSPTTFVFIWAVKADGTAASNVGWGRDSATTEVVDGSRKLRAVRVKRQTTIGVPGGWIVEAPVTRSPTLRPVFRLKIETGSYAAANVEFTGANLIDLGAAPTETVVLRGVASVPEGSAAIFEVRNNADTDWITYEDGDTAAEVGITQTQTRKMRCRLSPNSQGDATPIVWEIGLEDTKRVKLWDVATVRRARWSIPDVAELVPAIPECEIVALRNGERDFNDRITKLLSDNYVGQLSFKLYIGDPNRSRSEWLHKDSFVLVDDYDPRASEIEILAVSPLALLKGALPVYNTATQKREGLRLANKTPKQVYDEIVNVQLAPDVLARYRGTGIEDESVLLTKTITDSDGKTEIDAVAHIAGAVVGSSQGLIQAFDFFTPSAVKVWFPSSKIRWRSTGPGLRQAVSEFFVRHEYDEEKGEYTSEARYVNGNALLAGRVGLHRIDSVPTMRDEVSRWIATREVADRVGRRRVETLGTGMLVWGFFSIEAYPELTYGDPVAVETDQFVARDPTSTTARSLKGALWAIGRIVDFDPLGQEFAVWIQSYSDIFGGGEAGVRVGLNPASIVLDDAQAVFRGGKLLVQWVGTSQVASVKVATSVASQPAAGTGTAANGSTGEFDAGSSFAYGDTVFITVTPYSGTGGTGLQGAARELRVRLWQSPTIIDPILGRPRRQAIWDDDHLALKADVADTTGERAHANVRESGLKPINRLFAKVLAADPDTFDSVNDGTTWKRVTGVSAVNRVQVASFTPGIMGAGNLFSNSSFELDSNADGVADDWNLYNNGPEGATPDLVADAFHGALAQRVTWSVANTSTKGVFRSSPEGGWKANVWYVVSWYAKGTGGAVGSLMGLFWNNGPNDVIADLNSGLSASYQRYQFRIRWTTNPVDPAIFCSITNAGGQAAGSVIIDAFKAEAAEVGSTYDVAADDLNTGKRLRAAVSESGTKLVNRLFAKPLAADPDTADSVADGALFAVVDKTALNLNRPDLALSGVLNKVAANILRTGGGATMQAIVANLTDASHAAAAMQESGGKVINRLFAKPLAADPDTLDSAADGTTYKRVLETAVNAGQVDLAKAGVIGKNLDNVADSATYARILAAKLSAGAILRSATFSDGKRALAASDAVGKETDDDLFISATKTVKVGTVASPSSITKTLRVHSAEFTPTSDVTKWFFQAVALRPNQIDATMTYSAPLAMPKGVTITNILARMRRSATSDIAKVELRRISGDASTLLATVTHATTGWDSPSASLSQLVGEETYTLVASLFADVTIADAELQYVEVTYTMPDYSKGY